MQRHLWVLRTINITFSDQARTALQIMVNIQIDSSTTVSLGVYGAQADRLKEKVLAMGVPEVSSLSA
ncbi:hypothetical protein Bca4012_035914 [Brassica carinata]